MAHAALGGRSGSRLPADAEARISFPPDCSLVEACPMLDWQTEAAGQHPLESPWPTSRCYTRLDCIATYPKLPLTGPSPANDPSYLHASSKPRGSAFSPSS